MSYYGYADNPYDSYADLGYGRFTVLSEKFHRARKDHACAYCKAGIKAGTVYRARFVLDEGEPPFAEKTCDDCVAEEYGIPRPDEVETMIREDEKEVVG